MRAGVVCAVMVGVAWACASRAHAQTPAGTAFSYQGRLTDAGIAATGTYDLQFTLYDAGTGNGTIGGPLVKDDVQVTGGLFTVSLDFRAVFTGQARWLEIAVRPGASTGAFTTLAARQEITPAPHATFSQTAASSQTAVSSQTAASVPWSGITGKPASFADDVDNDALGALACAPNQIPKWAGAAWICAADADGTNAWQLGGNASSFGQLLGTKDMTMLQVAVNNRPAIRINPAMSPVFAPAIIGGHEANTYTGTDGPTIAGGGSSQLPNNAFNWAFVGGGFGNNAGGEGAVVAGGSLNRATGDYAFIGGGTNNQATGNYAMALGGADNMAVGDYSFAGGRGAAAVHPGSFVWGDSNTGTVTSLGPNQFVVRASKFSFVSATPGPSSFIVTSTGATLSGTGVWTNASDRNLKEHFAPIDGRALLDQLARLPITRWNYKIAPDVPHIGPTAQDFLAVFGVGGDDKTITTLDPAGIALRAIQQLDEENRALEQQLAALQRQVDALLQKRQSKGATHHSARSATIGSIRDARRAGK